LDSSAPGRDSAGHRGELRQTRFGDRRAASELRATGSYDEAGEMNGRLSLSIFTIEIDGRPTLALQAKKYSEVEDICEQQWFRADLTALKSNGVPLCDTMSIFRVRLAHPDEAGVYREAAEAAKPSDGINIVYLVDIDDDLF
jgi:hypothetical protein